MGCWRRPSRARCSGTEASTPDTRPPAGEPCQMEPGWGMKTKAGPSGPQRPLYPRSRKGTIVGENPVPQRRTSRTLGRILVSSPSLWEETAGQWDIYRLGYQRDWSQRIMPATDTELVGGLLDSKELTGEQELAAQPQGPLMAMGGPGAREGQQDHSRCSYSPSPTLASKWYPDLCPLRSPEGNFLLPTKGHGPWGLCGKTMHCGVGTRKRNQDCETAGHRARKGYQERSARSQQ